MQCITISCNILEGIFQHMYTCKYRKRVIAYSVSLFYGFIIDRLCFNYNSYSWRMGMVYGCNISCFIVFLCKINLINLIDYGKLFLIDWDPMAWEPMAKWGANAHTYVANRKMVSRVCECAFGGSHYRGLTIKS